MTAEAIRDTHPPSPGRRPGRGPAGLALLLAMAPFLAAAAPSGVPDKPGMPVAPDLCTAGQRATIEAAFGEAGTRLAAAIALLESAPEDAHVRRWFGGARRKLLRVNLGLIAAALRPEARPALICNPSRPCDAGNWARASTVGRSLTFCPRFFDSPAAGQDSRFGVVIHELSHIVIGTRDATYQPARSEALARDEPRVAATNADNYEYFVELLPESRPAPGSVGKPEPLPSGG
ncbi:M35 family metallo-endopeptidase [Roseomonas sp. NAR14]|uniref:M35 family metallo-endopeptidase n=1 Tax=Roseomonas acroporae TaxID=2937791 RepID=A0A9X1YD11_9PROT|nr:M35 family metallo-endopeptidase [Roseomonas acroporae]MCK8787878.1 M35 family metallo-endopeptidase [Roseomonas acroporae]